MLYNIQKYLHQYSMRENWKNIWYQTEKYGSLMEIWDHPEMDECDLLDQEQMAQYQILIGSEQWDISLGWYDVQYVKYVLAIFFQQPKEVHMNRDFSIFGYLNHYLWENIHFDTQQIKTEGIEFLYDNE